MSAINYGKNILIHDIDGYRILLDTNDLHMSIHMIENRVWEPQIREILKCLLKQDGVYVDVGSNIGLHTVYAAGLLKNKNGRVYAIEPNIDVYNILRKNVDINGFFDVVSMYNIGISDKNTKGNIYIYNGHAGGSGLGITDEFHTDYVQQEIEITTLDKLLEKKHIDILKIDVEGFEANVLRGAVSVLEFNPDITIIMEWNPKLIQKNTGEKSLEYIFELIRTHGYNVYLAKFMHSLKQYEANDLDVLLLERGDLILTKQECINNLISKSVLDESVITQNQSKKEIEFRKQASDEPVITQNELKKEIEFGKQAFDEAVIVQNELKKIIYEPTINDVWYCIKRYFKNKL